VARPTALVTGASSGIGVELARQLASRGYDVCVVARRAERLEALKATIEAETPAKVHVMPVNLASTAEILALAATLQERGLHIDCLVNNAGFGYQSYLEERTAAAWEEMIQVNCSAVVTLTRALLPGMIERKHGEILNVASIASFQAVASMTTYAATKAFVISFSEGLRLEAMRHGVRVSCLCPGATRSEFAAVAQTRHRDAPGFAWMTAARVANLGIRGMKKNSPVVIPGLLNKLLIHAQALLPRRLVNAITAWMFRPVK